MSIVITTSDLYLFSHSNLERWDVRGNYENFYNSTFCCVSIDTWFNFIDHVKQCRELGLINGNIYIKMRLDIFNKERKLEKYLDQEIIPDNMVFMEELNMINLGYIKIPERTKFNVDPHFISTYITNVPNDLYNLSRFAVADNSEHKDDIYEYYRKYWKPLESKFNIEYNERNLPTLYVKKQV